MPKCSTCGVEVDRVTNSKKRYFTCFNCKKVKQKEWALKRHKEALLSNRLSHIKSITLK